MGKQERAGILAFVLDLIYPPACLLCGAFLEPQRGSYAAPQASFCPECLADLRPIRPPYCPVCSVPMPQGRPEGQACGACTSNRPAYRAASAPFVYEGSASEAIKQLKYDKKTFLAPFLAALMVPLAETCLARIESPLLMPVPLHPRRLRERGFNQSLLLARVIAGRLELELDYLSLRRVRYTPSQMSLDMKSRHTNVRTAFGVTRPSACAGRNIVLIDDVATTGTTLNECALVLREAGARDVVCLTFAKAAV